jgi:septal ring factor EnvC (AmiA/AmiB activator)
MVDAETVVTLTLKQILTGIVALVVLAGAVLWTVLSFTIGGARDDVRTIRDSIVALQTADRETLNRTRDVELKLTEQIAGMRTDFVNASNKLDNLGTSINALTGRIDNYQKDLAAAQISLNDPKRMAQLIDSLKQAGIDEQKIIIIPFGLPFTPR